MRKSLVAFATLLVVLCCTLSLRASANDGDWVEGNIAQWWWKYVRVGDGSVKVLSPQVRITEVRSDKAGYRAYHVAYQLTNQSKTLYKGGEIFKLETQVADPQPDPWKPYTVAKGATPMLKAGESALISAVIYTPEKGDFNNFVSLSIQ
jgi:hypothetical protein